MRLPKIPELVTDISCLYCYKLSIIDSVREKCSESQTALFTRSLQSGVLVASVIQGAGRRQTAQQ